MAQFFLVVAQMESGEADVGEFFLAERCVPTGIGVRPLLNLACRQRGRCRASRQRKRQSGEAKRRHCGFGLAVLFRSLSRPPHGRILQGFKKASSPFFVE